MSVFLPSLGRFRRDATRRVVLSPVYLKQLNPQSLKREWVRTPWRLAETPMPKRRRGLEDLLYVQGILAGWDLVGEGVNRLVRLYVFEV